ncbi:biotin synthesis protein BioG [Cricetibacter osteomyelitidis]|uniref:Biotin synthesis protein BioG n=1 Tax=Cricetibacter osteomyelitidis TaxID=1521931 RepID=A0A4V2T1T3_9PAST|nr:pimeloyl-ACP methyl esterase BioG family protein [Cricetibacter osteomyelitidis]TCP94813.1 biotin synthesis protein BioG [Cricetibacter osteomyelitidis]
MKTKLISSQQPDLIVYFAGWGTPVSAVEHLALPQGYDLLLCYDYRNLDLAFDFLAYEHIRLVAWSMGVWVAEQTMTKLPLLSATAINGTALPCDDQFGIPKAIFEGTLSGLNAVTRTKFERRMCGDKQNFTQYQQLNGQRSDEEILSELTALYGFLQKHNETDKIQWTKAIIGLQDRIFPAENQQAYWTNRTVISPVDKAHYLLAEYHCWEQLF